MSKFLHESSPTWPPSPLGLSTPSPKPCQDKLHMRRMQVRPKENLQQKKQENQKNLPLYNLTLERTLMTCDLKKLGCFFFSPWDETFCANDVSWYEHNADVGVCHEDAYNSPCPWPPSQEGSKHSVVTPWAASCQTRDPRYHWGVAWPWIEAEGYTTLLCFWWCHSHTREKTHSLHQSDRPTTRWWDYAQIPT